MNCQLSSFKWLESALKSLGGICYTAGVLISMPMNNDQREHETAKKEVRHKTCPSGHVLSLIFGPKSLHSQTMRISSPF